MSIHPKDVLFYAGGECIQNFGVPVMRQTRTQDSAATFTRSGTVGGFMDSDSVFRQASANRPRIDWSSGSPALLLEAAASNYIRHSDNITSGFWSASNANRTAADAVAPDGTTTASKIYDNSASGVPHRILHASGTITAGQYQPITGFAKADEYDRLLVSLGDYNATDFGGVDIDLDAGTITDNSGGDGATSDLKLEAWGTGGWYRFSFMARVDTTSTSAFLYIGLHNGTSASYNGDGASGLHVWRIGLDADGAFPSSSIATTSAEVTRPADVLYAPFIHAPQEMTAYAKFIEGGTVNISSGGVFHIGASNNSTDPRLLMFEQGGFYAFRHDNGTTSLGSQLAVAPSLGDVVELRGILNTDGSVQVGQSINGASETLATASAAVTLQSAWADSRLYIGSLGSASQGVNAFRAIKVVRGVQTMADMRALYGVA